ncbi:hypothetical protein LY76DRAFT_677911, partial [Colletotrichum caudatum]
PVDGTLRSGALVVLFWYSQNALVRPRWLGRGGGSGFEMGVMATLQQETIPCGVAPVRKRPKRSISSRSTKRGGGCARANGENDIQLLCSHGALQVVRTEGLFVEGLVYMAEDGACW